MNYFERLIQRATAQPRQVRAPLVDPFAQEAPWELDPLRTSLPAGQADARRLPDPSAQLQYGLPASLAAGAGDGVEPAQLSPVARPIPHPDPPTPSLGSPPQPLPLTPVGHLPEEPPTPLAIADAFMRSFGIAQPAQIAQPNGPAPTETLHPPQEPQAIRSNLKALSPQSPAAAPPRAMPGIPALSAAASPDSYPPLLRPLPVAASPPPPAAPARPAATIPLPPEPAPGRPRGSDAPKERIVQTTVVLSAPSRRLDDLAHSSGISRFGLGQS